MRGFHDLLRQNPVSFFMLFGWILRVTDRQVAWIPFPFPPLTLSDLVLLFTRPRLNPPSPPELFPLAHSLNPPFLYSILGPIDSRPVTVTCSLYFRRDSPALKMEAIRSSETSVLTTTTRHQIPEDDFLHIHRRENFKSYVIKVGHLVAHYNYCLLGGNIMYVG
jgi:hypothetical protein